MSYSSETEVPLTGGNTAPVVRIGSTVRRRVGPWTPTIQALLGHIHNHGFTDAPKPLGLDEHGRETVSFLEGETGQYPLPEWMWEDRVLAEVANLERRYHDSTKVFIPPADAIWQWPTHDPFEVICHNDFAPYNIIFTSKHPVGIIDFDMASPGPRLWDLAYTAYRFVPLTAPQNPDTPVSSSVEQRRRLNLFCITYGMDVQASSVLHSAVRRLSELMDFIVTQAAAGDCAQQRVLERGDVEIYKTDRAYIQESLISEL